MKVNLHIPAMLFSRLGSLGFVAAVLVLLLGALAVTGPFAFYLGVPFADTVTYAEPWTNFFAGRGYVTRFNVVHAWPGTLDRPAIAYYNPLFGLLAALPWHLSGTPAAMGLFASAVPCSLNAALIAVLARRSFGAVPGLLAAAGYLLLPGTWFSLGMITAEHAMLTMALLALLVAEYAVPRDHRFWALVGVVVGVGLGVKTSLLMLLPGLAVVIFLTQSGGFSQRVRPVAGLAFGAAGVLLVYSAITLVTVGEMYPSYPALARNWSLATTFGGSFASSVPAIVPDPAALPGGFTSMKNVLSNVQAMFLATAAGLGPLLVFLPFALFRSKNDSAGGRGPDAQRLSLLLFGAGASMGIGYAAAFNWLELGTIGSTDRYAFHVTAFWLPVAIQGAYVIAGFLTPSRSLRVLLLIGLWCAVSASSVVARVQAYPGMLQGRTVPRIEEIARKARIEAALVGPDELVALDTGHIRGALFFDRPVVALPTGRMRTQARCRQFFAVYEPALVISNRPSPCARVLPQLGYAGRRIEELGGLEVFERARSNVVWIVLDAARAPFFGAYGNALPTTPNIDAFAADATVFEHAFAQATWTRPSTASFLTGRYPNQAERQGRLVAGQTIAAVLQAAGLQTGAFSENPYVVRQFGFADGFDTFREYFPYRLISGTAASFERVDTASTISDAIAWLERADRPFFLYVHLLPPHAPYPAPAPFLGRFDPDYEGAVHGTPDALQEIAADERRIGARDLLHLKLEYQENLAFADAQAGRLLDALSAMELLDETVVVVSSDHGEMFREHGKLLHNVTLYDEVLHVPLVMRFPPRLGDLPERFGGVVELRQIVPTLCDALGLGSCLAGGTSLLETLRDEDQKGSAIAFSRAPGGRPLVGVISSGHKLVVEGPVSSGATLLFDRARDPGETVDLSESQPSLVSQLRERLRAQERVTVKTRQQTLDPDSRARLEALGYVE